MSFLSQILVVFGYYYTIICLFNRFSDIKGFTLYEVLLTFGIITFGFSFCETFARGIDQFDDLIVKGTFDKLMLRPRNLLFQACCDQFQFSKLSRVLQAIIVIIISMIKMDVTWSFDKILTLILMLISSVVLFFSIFILMAAYCFYTVKGLEVRNVLTDGCKQMAQYPIGIFKKGFVSFFTYVIPFGLVNYYPLLYILGRTDKTIYMYAPVFVFLFFIPCVVMFNHGVKKYNSSGS